MMNSSLTKFMFYVICIITISMIVVTCVPPDKRNLEEDNVTWEKPIIYDDEIFDDIPSTYTYQISENGINHIKKYEHCKLTAYWDGNCYSIGWGHHSKSISKGMVITQEEADNYFNHDIQWAVDRANVLINDLPYKYEFSQSFFDGLVSLIYNAGIGNVYKSTFYKRLKYCRVINGIMNEEDYDYTVSSIKTFKCKHKGNKARRLDEYLLMSCI